MNSLTKRYVALIERGNGSTTPIPVTSGFLAYAMPMGAWIFGSGLDDSAWLILAHLAFIAVGCVVGLCAYNIESSLKRKYFVSPRHEGLYGDRPRLLWRHSDGRTAITHSVVNDGGSGFTLIGYDSLDLREYKMRLILDTLGMIDFGELQLIPEMLLEVRVCKSAPFLADELYDFVSKYHKPGDIVSVKNLMVQDQRAGLESVKEEVSRLFAEYLKGVLEIKDLGRQFRLMLPAPPLSNFYIRSLDLKICFLDL